MSETKRITVDHNAHEMLLWAKRQLQRTGVKSPSHSDAIRYLRKTHCWLEDMDACASGGNKSKGGNLIATPLGD